MQYATDHQQLLRDEYRLLPLSSYPAFKISLCEMISQIWKERTSLRRELTALRLPSASRFDMDCKTNMKIRLKMNFLLHLKTNQGKKTDFFCYVLFCQLKIFPPKIAPSKVWVLWQISYVKTWWKLHLHNLKSTRFNWGKQRRNQWPEVEKIKHKKENLNLCTERSMLLPCSYHFLP